MPSIFSHQLAALAGVTAAQIRRDLTYVGYNGSPRLGYSVADLKTAIESFLIPGGDEKLALIGVGNLGRAVLDYFRGRHRRISVIAAFDVDSEKAGRVIHGCRCHPMEDLERIVEEQGIVAAIIAVPADQAQGVADAAMLAGIKGFLNFAPVSLRTRRDVYVDNNDLTTAIERVAFFAREKDSSGGQEKQTR